MKGRGTDIEVLGVDFIVLGEVVVLFGDEYTLCSHLVCEV